MLQSSCIDLAQNNMQDELRSLLALDPYVVNERDWAGHTALAWACIKGHTEIASLLVSFSADVNIRDNSSCTPLMWAAVGGHTEVVKILILNCAAIDGQDNAGRTALMAACELGWLEIVQFLVSFEADINMKNDEGKTALMFAADAGHYSIVSFLLENSADVNLTNNDGDTCLLVACEKTGNIDIIELFVSAGAFVDVANKHNCTPLMLAVSAGEKDSVKYLLTAGASVSSKDKSGMNALAIACRDGHLDIARKLICNNAKIDTTDNQGNTPLIWASRNGHLDLVKLLVYTGADISAQNMIGKSSIIWAAINGHLEIVRHILTTNVNELHTADKNGNSPLIWATMQGHKGIVMLLLYHGANITFRNQSGKDAITLAKQYGETQILDLLVQEQSERAKWFKVGRKSDTEIDSFDSTYDAVAERAFSKSELFEPKYDMNIPQNYIHFKTNLETNMPREVNEELDFDPSLVRVTDMEFDEGFQSYRNNSLDIFDQPQILKVENKKSESNENVEEEHPAPTIFPIWNKLRKLSLKPKPIATVGDSTEEIPNEVDDIMKKLPSYIQEKLAELDVEEKKINTPFPIWNKIQRSLQEKRRKKRVENLRKVSKEDCIEWEEEEFFEFRGNSV